jgi:hypothetical protein
MAGQETRCPHCGEAVHVNIKLNLPEIPLEDRQIPQPPTVRPAEDTRTQSFGKALLIFLYINLAISVIAFIALVPRPPEPGAGFLFLYCLAFQLVFIFFIHWLLRDNKALYNWVNWLKENLPKMIEQGRSPQDEKTGEEKKQ